MRFASAIVLISISVAAASAQQNVIVAQPVFNGQKVDAVDLIGNPHRDLEPLRAVVLQRAGATYSEEQVQASIRALEKAGNFPKVTVEVVPDAAGLRLNFLLEPAYYLGIIDFPGAVKKLPYTRLLEVSNLSDEDPYDPARLPLSEQALQDFFRRSGYFQATIRTNSVVDDQHQLVNVNFDLR